jgi:hypothetical protein
LKRIPFPPPPTLPTAKIPAPAKKNTLSAGPTFQTLGKG